VTTRDQDILKTLSQRIRILTADQISTHWWNSNRAASFTRLKAMASWGLLELTPAFAQILPPVTVPLLQWNPKKASPNMGAVSYALKARWSMPVQSTIIVTATKRGAATVGGFGGRLPRASETAHDIGMAEVYLHFRHHHPEREKGWRPEAFLYEQGWGQRERLPDAMIVTRAEKTVIEFGGAYSKNKLQAFHAAMADKNLGYELW